MRSFALLRHPTSAASMNSRAAGLHAEFQDTLSEPRLPDLRGWSDSSRDLKYGLQVQEGDFNSLPAEVQAAFAPR